MEVPPAENGSIVSAMDTDHHQTDRNSSQIIASYDQTLSQIKSLFGQLAEIKRTPSATLEDKQAKCLPLLQKIIVLFSELRVHNREIYLDVEHRKSKSVACRSRLDSHVTSLQHAQFELQFLLREIHNTREYKPREREVLLITDEEFEQSAPPELKVLKISNPHLYEINRLNHELQQRKSLLARSKELLMRKKALAEANASKVKYLEGLVLKLKSLTKAAVPIQTYLGIQTSKVRNLHLAATLLPAPLYNLVQLASAYKEAFADAEVDVDVKTAIDLESLKVGAPLPSTLTQALDTPKKLSEVDPKKASIDLYKPHPIGVQLDVRCSSAANSPSASLLFQYLVHLGLVTVTVQGAGADHTLLVNLFGATGDFGAEVPSTAVHFKYADGSEFRFASSQVGRPFQWAQSLCGLLFFAESTLQPASQRDLVTPQQLRTNFRGVIRAIKARLRVRQALASQLDMLARLLIPATVGSASTAPKDAPSFSAWRKIAQVDFDAIDWPPTQTSAPTVKPASTNSASQYFRATFTRADETVEVFIEISAAYPDRAPQLKFRFSNKQFPMPSSSAASSSLASSSQVKKEEKGKMEEGGAGGEGGEKMAVELPPALEIAYKKLAVLAAGSESSTSGLASSTESDSRDFLLSTMLRKFRASWTSKLVE